MKTFRLFAAVLIAAMLPGWTFSQPAPPRAVAVLWDLDSATETFPLLETRPREGSARVTTSSSSVTVTAVSGSPYTDVSVSDRLVIGNAQAGTFQRTVMTRASATSITVDTALNISTGAAFQWYKMNAGTTVTDGWFEMGKRPGIVDIAIVQMVATGGIDVRLQCATTSVDGTIRPRQVYPVLTPPTSTASYINFTAAGGMAIEIPAGWDRCRVGAKIGSADDGGDLTTNQEQITIAVEFGVVR